VINVDNERGPRGWAELRYDGEAARVALLKAIRAAEPRVTILSQLLSVMGPPSSYTREERV
jgi:hypothetical protein